MFELSWLELAFYILAAYAWGRWVQWRLTIQRMASDPKRFADILGRLDAIQQADALGDQITRIELRAEWHNDICYLYRKDTNEFVGQGQDVDSAIQNAHGLDDACEYVIAKDNMVNKTQQIQP